MNVSSPAFSVVMAAHNNAATIGEAIESVRRQTRPDWELIVVDDCSSDGTATVAEAFADARIRVTRQTENRGPAATRNRGISLAHAPVICLLDSDDLWLPCYLETMARALDAHPEAGLVCADAWVLNEGTGRVRKTSAVSAQNPPDPLPDDPRSVLHELLQRNFIYYSVAARRETLAAAGGYDERLWVGEDWELWLRLAAAGIRFVSIPQLLGVHRKWPGSLTSSSERLLQGRLEVYRVVAEDWDTSAEVREHALNLSRARQLRSQRRAKAAALLVPIAAVRRKLRESILWQEPPRDVADLLLTLAPTRQG